MLEVTLLGTGGMIPLKNRWLTSLWVEKDGKALLIDCGEGTQIAAAEKGKKLSRIEMILITHNHADHIAGLPGFLLSMGNCGKTGSVRVLGPVGTKYTVTALRTICPFLPFEVVVEEILDGQAHEEWNGLTIGTISVIHDMPCLAYSFTMVKRLIFAPEKAKALGIDVKYWKSLHSGETVEIDGKRYTPDMVTDGVRDGVKVTYMTDTRYFDGLVDFAADSDLLVCESMYASDEYADKMREKGHMVMSQALRIAEMSGSKRLWLTHFSPAFTDIAAAEEQGRAVFHGLSMNDSGNTIVLK